MGSISILRDTLLLLTTRYTCHKKSSMSGLDFNKSFLGWLSLLELIIYPLLSLQRALLLSSLDLLLFLFSIRMNWRRRNYVRFQQGIIIRDAIDYIKSYIRMSGNSSNKSMYIISWSSLVAVLGLEKPTKVLWGFPFVVGLKSQHWCCYKRFSWSCYLC